MLPLSDKYLPSNKSLSYTYPEQGTSNLGSLVDTNEELNLEEIQRYLLDVLGASIWQEYPQTFAYRWRGEDTLTWGNLGIWLLVDWIRKGFTKTSIVPILNQYDVLEEIKVTTNSYKLEELYEYRNGNEVVNYLQSNPELIDFLQKSHYHLLKHFETTAKLALEVVCDPEAQHKQLIIYISTSLPIDDALIRLDRLDSEWFLAHINRFGHLLNFNLEIV
jgi:hypothetical protein